MVAEAARVLRCGGVFLCISHDDGRLPMLMGTEQGAGPEAAAALPWRLVELCEVRTVCKGRDLPQLRLPRSSFARLVSHRRLCRQVRKNKASFWAYVLSKT